MNEHVRAISLLLIAVAMLLVLGVTMYKRPYTHAQIAATEAVTYRIKVNSANRETLCLLPGIGPGLAQRIHIDRNVHGPFTSASDMTRVKMVGEKTAAAIEPWAVFD